MTEKSEPWHLDKRVPVALIVTIVFQSVAAVWWAATINSQVGRQQIDIDALKVSASQAEVGAARMSQEMSEVQRALARLESGQEQMNTYLREIFSGRGQ